MSTQSFATCIIKVVDLGYVIPPTLHPPLVSVPFCDPPQVCRYCGGVGRMVEFDADGLPFFQDCPVCTEEGRILDVTRSI